MDDHFDETRRIRDVSIVKTVDTIWLFNIAIENHHAICKNM
jgi:hypothetical protein